MKTFEEWCQHYDYDPESDEAREDYERYRQELQVLEPEPEKPEPKPAGPSPG